MGLNLAGMILVKIGFRFVQINLIFNAKGLEWGIKGGK